MQGEKSPKNQNKAHAITQVNTHTHTHTSHSHTHTHITFTHITFTRTHVCMHAPREGERVEGGEREREIKCK